MTGVCGFMRVGVAFLWEPGNALVGVQRTLCGLEVPVPRVGFPCLIVGLSQLPNGSSGHVVAPMALMGVFSLSALKETPT